MSHVIKKLQKVTKMLNVPDIKYKPKRCRDTQEFTVYPHQNDAKELKLQSDNYCIILDVEAKTMLISKRHAQYPRFLHCLESNGGTRMDTPIEILNQIDQYLKFKRDSGRRADNSSSVYYQAVGTRGVCL